MSDSISAISDDINRYKFLCKRFKVKVRYNERGNPDCYGQHSEELEKRIELENMKKENNKKNIKEEDKKTKTVKKYYALVDLESGQLITDCLKSIQEIENEINDSNKRVGKDNIAVAEIYICHDYEIKGSGIRIEKKITNKNIKKSERFYY